MKTLLIIIMLVCVPSFLFADTWESKDYWLLAGAVTTIAADCISTHNSIQQGHTENTLYLPEKPNSKQLIRAGIIGSCVVAGISYLLPAEYRRYFLVGFIGFELGLVYNNISVCVRY